MKYSFVTRYNHFQISHISILFTRDVMLKFIDTFLLSNFSETLQQEMFLSQLMIVLNLETLVCPDGLKSRVTTKVMNSSFTEEL